MTANQAGKGDRRRPGDGDRYGEGWELIWGTAKEQKKGGGNGKAENDNAERR